MQVNPINTANYQTKRQSFSGLHVIDYNVQRLLLSKFDNKQITTLSKLIKEQESNSVHVLLDSEDGKRLKASLLCEYRLKNFKAKYKQIPLIESKMHFIKRIVDAANKYKTQISDLEVLELKWKYSVLPEWAQKMYL